MNEILLKVQAYLDGANRGTVEMSPEILEFVQKAMVRTFDRHFNRGGKRDFRLAMSNIGRPLCQLWHEKNGTPPEPESYDFRMRMLFGDMIEIAAFAIMLAAGVKLEETQKRVFLRIDDETVIPGAIDTVINGKVWDVKSASSNSMARKFTSYENVKKSDPFGYVGQGFGYSEADQKPFGGWIAINKETGEWAVVEAPEDQEAEKAEALANIKGTVNAIKGDFPFFRQFEDVPEKFNKRETGNRVLSQDCSWCPYKRACWPDAVHKPQVVSDAKNPKWVWYTHIDDKYKDRENQNGK